MPTNTSTRQSRRTPGDPNTGLILAVAAALAVLAGLLAVALGYHVQGIS